MKTEISVDKEKFLINNTPTYEGKTYKNYSIEGLLFNSRMIQAIFDDEYPKTKHLWKYPDTNEWDPERNTIEFCKMLPVYRKYGLLAFTVGLQGGGSIYTPKIYNKYLNSAFTPDGELKEAYFNRLLKILKAADDAGMVVIVNYFYIKQAEKLQSEQIIFQITQKVTEWLLNTGYNNIIVDVVNEAAPYWMVPTMKPENVHKLIGIVKEIKIDDRRLLVSASSGGGPLIPTRKWLEIEDLTMPHGNGLNAQGLRLKIKRIRRTNEYKKRPRPLLINEDSVFLENLEAAISQYASWGFYCQGYGCNYQDRFDWRIKSREKEYENLSGYQTVPINWTINTPLKKQFFDRLKQITGGF